MQWEQIAGNIVFPQPSGYFCTASDEFSQINSGDNRQVCENENICFSSVWRCSSETVIPQTLVSKVFV